MKKNKIQVIAIYIKSNSIKRRSLHTQGSSLICINNENTIYVVRIKLYKKIKLILIIFIKLQSKISFFCKNSKNFKSNKWLKIQICQMNIKKYKKNLKKVLTKEKKSFIMYSKTLKRRVESYSISTETFRLVREMREKLSNMALESSHRDLFTDLGCDGSARYSIASMIVLNKVFLVIKR